MRQLRTTAIRRTALVVALLTILTMAISLFGCSSPTRPNSNSQKDVSHEKSFAEETFHDIVFDIPKDHSGGMISDKSAMYTLDQNSRDPFALRIHLQYDPDIDATAESWYETFSEFEECKLVTANGIEMCVQPEDNPSRDYESAAINFSHNGAFYSIHVEYRLDSNLGYEDYVQTFYETIRSKTSGPSGKNTNSASGTSKPSPNIPQQAVEWSQADQFIGKTATFYGKVVDTQYAATSNGSPTFLDLGKSYPSPDRLSVVIWGENRRAFSSAPENLYKNKTIAVTGTVYLYNGTCNIEVASPGQISILD